MANLKRWKVVKQFTVYEISLLAEGYDPADFDCLAFQKWNARARSDALPMLNALRHSINDGSLELHRVCYEDSCGQEIDFSNSLVHIEKLEEWLASAGVSGGFFAVPDTKPKVEDEFSAFYAPKLAAANAAWKAVTADPKRLRGKAPKQALQIWLEEHAAEYGLLNKEGKPNATGIEEIAKVANWKPGGGAPSTPKDISEPWGEFGSIQPDSFGDPREGSHKTPPDDDCPF